MLHRLRTLLIILQAFPICIGQVEVRGVLYFVIVSHFFFHLKFIMQSEAYYVQKANTLNNLIY